MKSLNSGSSIWRATGIVVCLAAGVLMTGCSNSGGGAAGGPGQQGFDGTAAHGKALAHATVHVQCLNATLDTGITTDAVGHYVVTAQQLNDAVSQGNAQGNDGTATVQYPCILSVDDPDTGMTYYGTVLAPGDHANISPFTTMVLARSYGNNLPALTPATVAQSHDFETAQKALKNSLEHAAGIDGNATDSSPVIALGGVNFFTDHYVIGDLYDQWVDAFMQALVSDGVAFQDVLNAFAQYAGTGSDGVDTLTLVPPQGTGDNPGDGSGTGSGGDTNGGGDSDSSPPPTGLCAQIEGGQADGICAQDTNGNLFTTTGKAVIHASPQGHFGGFGFGRVDATQPFIAGIGLANNQATQTCQTLFYSEGSTDPSGTEVTNDYFVEIELIRANAAQTAVAYYTTDSTDVTGASCTFSHVHAQNGHLMGQFTATVIRANGLMAAQGVTVDNTAPTVLNIAQGYFYLPLDAQVVNDDNGGLAP